MSATCGNPSVRRRCFDAFGEKCASGSSPSTLPTSRKCRPFAPIASAPCSSERTSSQPTCGCSASVETRRGMALLDLLERHPAGLIHEIDEPEVPRREHDDVLSGDVVLRPLLLRAAACRLADRVADGAVVLVARVEGRDVRGLERTAHEVVEAVAIALLERRTLGLPVVGEDDNLVGPGRETAGAPEAPELLVELAQAPRACRPARDPSGAPPRRSSRTSRTRQAARPSCPSAPTARSGHGRQRTSRPA